MLAYSCYPTFSKQLQVGFLASVRLGKKNCADFLYNRAAASLIFLKFGGSVEPSHQKLNLKSRRWRHCEM